MTRFIFDSSINQIILTDTDDLGQSFDITPSNISGGSLSNGVLSLSGDQSGVFFISGFTGGEDTNISGGTFASNILTLSGSQGIIEVTGFTSSDTFITGGTLSNTGNLSLSGGSGIIDIDLSSLSGDTNVTGGTAVASAGTLSLSGAQNVTNLTGLAINIPPVFVTQSSIYTHIDASANATSNALTQNVTLPVDGDYVLTLSFNYNNDTANSDIVVYSTFNGNALDLNNRSADPQGVNQILRAEVKDSNNSPGGAVTGTGSGQKYSYCMQFLLNSQTAGTYPFIIDVGSETANVESSIWNVIAKFEYIIT